MPINSKRKGSKFELEVAHLFRDWGYDAHRTAQYHGKTGQAADVQIDGSGLHIECKNYKEIAVYKWYEQAVNDSKAAGKGDIPIVVFKGNNKPPMVMLAFEDFIQMYNEFASDRDIRSKDNVEMD